MMDPTRKNLCHCGCHYDTHFPGGSCLGMRCNKCPGFRDATKPDTLVVVKKKHPSKWHPIQRQYIECNCYDCKQVGK